jgi:alanyl-tRNA synthetase
MAPHKGGVRLSFVCGSRALAYLQKTRGVLKDIAHAYSCKTEDIPNAAQALRRELSEAKRENILLQKGLVCAASRELGEKAKIVNGRRLIVRLVDLPASQLRALASALCEAGKTLAFLLARTDEGARYVLCRSDELRLEIGELTQHINQALGARGGGRGNLAQGSASHVTDLERNVEQLSVYMERRLEALGRLESVSE